ncbi:MAG TPA: twin-arginine translocase subunit TatC [Thermoleophilaceae bacterium]|nr:twin-arginine translocase subunit TatC [Thermoleophilaceae bacterium]
MARLRPVSHEDELSVVDHLDELRTRVVISLLAVISASAVCFWQDNLVLDLLNDPLPDGREPITLAPTEAFMTTITVSAYAGILIALPVVLYQLYAFVLPAFTPTERRVATPLLVLVPILFITGTVFAYFVILQPALDFLLNFNADEFQTEVRARDYYSFVMLLLIAMGLMFQVPIGVLSITRLGIVSVEQLRKNRRYAILGLVVIAALLPTVDPVTLVLETIPLIVLYELSILLAAWLGRPPPEVAEAMDEDEAP